MNTIIHIQLLDRRKKALFEGEYEREFEQEAAPKALLKALQADSSQIIPSIVAQSASQYSNALERLSSVRIMRVNFEWAGERIKKELYLRP